MRVALAVVAAAALLAAAGGAPGVPRMALADVLGRTVCPLQVVVDDDPLRLPRRIQFLTCAGEAASCAAPGAAAAACCRRVAPAAQCVELFDHVLVSYLPHEGAPAHNASRHVVQVPVGCACVVARATPAAELP